MTLASKTTIKVVAVGSNLDEKDLFQFRLWCSFAKNKRLGIKIKHACVRSDVVFTKISASFLYKVWMIFWCASSLSPPKSFPIERNVIKYEKIVGFLFRLIKTHCYQRKLELEWWSWLYFLNDFLSFGIPPCKNKKESNYAETNLQK